MFKQFGVRLSFTLESSFYGREAEEGEEDQGVDLHFTVSFG